MQDAHTRARARTHARTHAHTHTHTHSHTHTLTHTHGCINCCVHSSVANSAVFPRNWASFRSVLFRHRYIYRYFWASFKSGGFYVMCYIKSRHILRHIINYVNYQFKAVLCFWIQALPTPALATQLSTNKGNNHSLAPGCHYVNTNSSLWLCCAACK